MKHSVLTLTPLAAALALSVFTTAFAQETATLEETIVYGSFVPINAMKTGSAYSVLDAKTIENAGIVQVSDLLKMLPGIAVSRFAGRGSLTEIRIRGAESNHVLVTIDGIEVNSEATGGGAQFAGLTSNDIA
ncbi:MAG: TonB-dependent receptor plug domain-containing protein, partial [Arenicellales bacterium]